MSAHCPAYETAINDLENSYVMIRGELGAAEAIAGAARVLCALERAPAHHDTHPSHNIITGNGYAHGLRVSNDCLPGLLEHVCHLIESSLNEAGCMRERASDALRQIAAEGRQS